MENKNQHLKNWEERSACYKQMLPLAEQPFERQRKALLDIEGQVRAIVGDDPMLVSHQDIRPHCKELQLLLLKRYWLLNWMFKETTETYERMRQVNRHLYDMDRQLHEQMADICEKLVREPKPSFVDDYEVRGMLGFSFDNKDSVLTLSIDEDYGSNYPLMMSVNESLLKAEKLHCGSSYLGTGLEWCCRYDHTRKEILDDILDNGVSWAHELPTPFEGLCICHTTVAFVKDLCYPVFDLLHVNDFWSEVEVAYQHFTQIKSHSPEKDCEVYPFR